MEIICYPINNIIKPLNKSQEQFHNDIHNDIHKYVKKYYNSNNSANSNYFGNLTYFDLLTKINNIITQNKNKQTPQISSSFYINNTMIFNI